MKTSYQLILAALAVCITASCSSGHDETPEPIKIPISLSYFTQLRNNAYRHPSHRQRLRNQRPHRPLCSELQRKHTGNLAFRRKPR